MLLRKTGLKTKGLDSTASDKSLERERQTFTRDGKQEHGFTSSIVPTIEEKLITEQAKKEQNGEAQHGEDGHPQHAHNGDARGPQNGSAKPKDNAPEARVDGQLYGVPANGDVQHDDKMPGTQADDSDTEDEGKALDARKTVRKHLSAKLNSKQWTLPTPTPHVDPHGFEDPICDAFWKNMWLASAVHNVGYVLLVRSNV